MSWLSGHASFQAQSLNKLAVAARPWCYLRHLGSVVVKHVNNHIFSLSKRPTRWLHHCHDKNSKFSHATAFNEPSSFFPFSQYFSLTERPSSSVNHRPINTGVTRNTYYGSALCTRARAVDYTSDEMSTTRALVNKSSRAKLSVMSDTCVCPMMTPL